MSWLLLLAIIGQPAAGGPSDSVGKAQKPINFDRTSIHSALSDRGLSGQPDRWFAMDKFWHFSASLVTVGAAYHLAADRASLSSPLSAGLAAGGTLTLGITKEFCDLAGPSKRFSWKDLAADAAGVGVGYLVFIHQF